MGLGLRGFKAAVSFLTRVPVRGEQEEWLSRAPAWFPTVGALVGALVGLSYAAAESVVGPGLGAVVAVALGVLVTGGFHEDGLADTADSFGSGHVGDRALEIMRDSLLGTYGTLALAIAVLWRVAVVASLDVWPALAALVISGALGRAAVVVMMGISPSARPDSVGRQMVIGADSKIVVTAVATALGIGVLMGGWWVLPSAVSTVPIVWWMRRTAIDKVGGVTGDVLGAAEQLCEMAILGVILAIARSGGDLWWL